VACPFGGDIERVAEPDAAVELEAGVLPEDGQRHHRPRGVVEFGGGPALRAAGVGGVDREDGAFPGVDAGLVFGADARQVFLGFGKRGELLLDGHDGAQGLAAGPGLDAGAAPGSVDDADGHAEFPAELFGEKVADGGELGGGLRRGACPLPGDGVARGGQRSLVDVEHAQLRVVGRGDIFGPVIGVGQFPLHVGLAGGEPDLADEDVVDDLFGAAFHAESVRAAGGQLRAGEFPSAIGGGDDLHGRWCGRRAFDGEGDDLLRVVLTPDRVGLIALQHQVVGEQRREKERGEKHGRGDCGRSQWAGGPAATRGLLLG